MNRDDKSQRADDPAAADDQDDTGFTEDDEMGRDTDERYSTDTM